jgi:hypothetical protein
MNGVTTYLYAPPWSSVIVASFGLKISKTNDQFLRYNNLKSLTQNGTKRAPFRPKLQCFGEKHEVLTSHAGDSIFS